MSVAPISGQMSASFAVASGTGAASTPATSALSATGQLSAANGAMGLQQSLLVQSGQTPSIDQLAALMIALLLNKSKESQNQDDPWKTLVALAMLGGFSGGQTSVSMSQSVSLPAEAYGACGAAAAAPSVNMQG